ncbi:response regulator [Rhodoferax saidenbachensis]|uniref:DNA-binding response regulator n=1 Tax=Rhodoferax saidenbachensis TaxID=1484693 RepID=A0A1P8KDY1_9BURK|nr:response regulator transcription factor [Rhodoferax saidenbachensis]APW44240.1 DNA-binding response regulator [Rhodoferax saidenbachensis]
MPIRTLVADDHQLMRAGLRKLLENLPDIEVMGEADNGLQLLEMAQSLSPDLVLMDISMPTLNGLDATAQLTKVLPTVRILILSMHMNEEYVRQALVNGAAGYILKDAAPRDFDRAIRTVMQGETYLSPEVSKGVMNDYVQRLRSESTETEVLTPRQREVLKLIAEGSSTKDIARRLDLSVKTADTHRTQLMRVLDIHDVAGLVRYAIRTGIISAES